MDTNLRSARSIFEDCLPEYHRVLDQSCTLYKHIGMGSAESPRWFQFQAVKSDNLTAANGIQVLFFKSSQCSVWMSVGVDFLSREEYKDLLHHRDTYDWFRSAKYAYIEKFHPTIKI